MVSFPLSTAEHLGGQDDELLLQHPASLRREADSTLQQLLAGQGGHVLLMESQVNQFLVSALNGARDRGDLIAELSDECYIQLGTRQAVRLLTLRKPVR